LQPIGVGLATLLAPAFDHSNNCTIRRTGASLAQGIAKPRSGHYLDLSAINEDSQN
jgi:hypothetical protein